MDKTTLIGLAALLCTGLTAPSFAGTKTNPTVVVNQTARIASGALGSARNSQDNLQFIGCSVIDSTGGAFVTCSARDSLGRSASCRSTDVGKVSVASSISSDSWVYFQYDALGNCTYLLVSTSSQYPSKTH